MKNALKKSVLLLAVVSLFNFGCSGGSSGGGLINLNPPTEKGTVAVEIPSGKQMSSSQQSVLETSDNLLSEGYDISEIRFSGNFVLPSPASQTFTVSDNQTFTNMMFYLEADDGKIEGYALKNAVWEFNSTNDKIYKEGNSGFTIKSGFKSSETAQITITVHYKEINKTFTFNLESTVSATPAPNISTSEAISPTEQGAIDNAQDLSGNPKTSGNNPDSVDPITDENKLSSSYEIFEIRFADKIVNSDTTEIKIPIAHLRGKKIYY
jgi:hypothetical protein